ncbi:MAG: FixH family protein [Chitinophagales bacterium]
MSWGYKITFLYIGFVAMILTMVVMSLRQDIQMVTDDYYEKEQDYTVQVQNSFNSESLSTRLQINYQANDKSLQLQFPQDFAGIEGEVEFYRPSNANKDFQVKIAVDSSNLQLVNTSDLIVGLWKVKVKWKANGKSFFDEKQVVIN